MIYCPQLWLEQNLSSLKEVGKIAFLRYCDTRNHKPHTSMKLETIQVSFSRGISARLLFAGLLVATTSGRSDLNEARVLRDASGVYTGQATGGMYHITYDDGSPGFSFTGHPADFKELARFKEGRSAGTITDDDLSGDGAGQGAATQKPNVVRGGRRIILRISNIVFEEDESDHLGQWRGGRADGTVDDKGAQWRANSTASASQRNGNPPDHTRRVTGRRIAGKD